MAIEIKREDFDTVCYSYRHNIIKLIEAAVGLSVQVNISIDLADQANQAVTDLDNLLHHGGGASGSDAGGEIGILQRLVESQTEKIAELTKRVDAIEGNTYTFRQTTLGQIIQELRDSV